MMRKLLAVVEFSPSIEGGAAQASVSPLRKVVLDLPSVRPRATVRLASLPI
jgi:hypothetical protein